MTVSLAGTTKVRGNARGRAVRVLAWPFAPAFVRAPLLQWYREQRRELPWRKLWAERADPYTVWVSEIMLQQTVIKAVLPAYARFMTEFPTLAQLAAADEESVRQAVRGLGYYRRFRFMHLAARALVAAGSVWPDTYEGWKELPGIGTYTAAAISSIAFGAPAGVVDGNVERVFCRLLDLREAPNSPALKKAFLLLAHELLDTSAPGDFNQAVMELGQTVCTVSQPRCGSCPLSAFCLANERGSQALAPAAKIKTAAPRSIKLRLCIPRQGALVGLVERPGTARFLKGTAGFLTALTDADLAAVAVGITFDGLALGHEVLASSHPVPGEVRHSITHHRISADVVNVTLAPDFPLPVQWLRPEQVEKRLLANLDRKAWRLASAFVPANDLA